MKKIFGNKQIGLHIVFILISLTFLLPFLLLVSVSFSDNDAIKEVGYTLIPKVFSLSAYKQIFSNPYQILQAYKITIIFTVLATVVSVMVMTMVSYSISRNNFKARNFVTWIVFFTMLFSGGMIPSYIINTKIFHLNDTIWIYVLPGAVGAWYVMIIRTFFKGLPESLMESAKLDGASEFCIFFKIVLPLSKPCIASVAFMIVVAKWNDWNTSLIYINNTKLYSLQYLLQRILRETEFLKQMAQESANFTTAEIPTESMRFALAMVAAGPVLVLFPAFQKYFAKGLTIGAIKG